jgi:hypothetical protein
MTAKDSIMCPSYTCKPGSKLLGVRGNDGKVSILPEALLIDQDFIDKVNADPVPSEQRFRFTNKCITSGCSQWTGKECGVIEEVVKYHDRLPDEDKLPTCSIRQNCRWFLQKAELACKVCPHILRQMNESDILVMQAEQIQ